MKALTQVIVWLYWQLKMLWSGETSAPEEATLFISDAFSFIWPQTS